MADASSASESISRREFVICGQGAGLTGGTHGDQRRDPVV
jgi:hypothetical protein